jgi:uncharacterized heparinase superfamily protein
LVSPGLHYRTAKHLTLKQWGWRAYCRGLFELMEKWPDVAQRRIRRAMLAIPAPQASSEGLAAAAQHVIQLQIAVHGESFESIRHGRFVLNNRAIDFGSLENVEWRRELGEGNNRLWRMALAYMGYLVPLIAADPHAGLETAAMLLTSMHAQNPWRSRGVFRDVWHPYTASHRVINLLACLHLASRAGIADDSPALIPLLDEIRFGGAFVAANLERDLQYNHLFKNYVCLAMLAAAGRQPRLSNSMLKSIRHGIHQQFLSDGGPAERSPMYHNLSLLDLRVLRDSGVMSSDLLQPITETVERGEAAAVVMAHPDGDVALFNDCWLGEAPATEAMTPKAALSCSEPIKLELPETGYARLAQGGDSVIMDFGACGPDDNPGHAHADFLSIELSVCGERAIIDPGVPTYSAGEERDRSRSAHAHNGPALEGLEPIEFWGSFRVGRRGYAHKLAVEAPGGNSLSFAAWHDGYCHQGAIVGRYIRLIPEHGLLILDVWIGQPARAAASNFIVSRNWKHTGGACFTSSGTVTPLKLRFEPMAGTTCGTEPVQYCKRFGMREEGTRVSLIPQLTSGVRWMACSIRWGASSGIHEGNLEQLRQTFLTKMLDVPAIKKCYN